ncbi:MAG: hypothetical protein ABC588_04475 [Candidatus Methanosuratincola petrocarbonis]
MGRVCFDGGRRPYPLRFCRECGKPGEKRWRYCWSCGAALRGDQNALKP